MAVLDDLDETPVPGAGWRGGGRWDTALGLDSSATGARQARPVPRTPGDRGSQPTPGWPTALGYPPNLKRESAGEPAHMY